MSEREARFAYRLETLIRLRSAERDAASAAAAQAAREVERRSRECDAIVHAIEGAEAELRALCASGESIAVDAQLRLQLYLRAERQRHRDKRHELGEATKVMDRLSTELQERSRDARALELHRERKRRAFDVDQQRASLNAADEQWLARKDKS
jgi:flagellar biosynthesis chaperone FliJ